MWLWDIIGLSGMVSKVVEGVVDARIKILESDLKIKIKHVENFHAITQAEYQNMFAKKMKAYGEIMKEISEYKYTVKEDPLFEMREYPTSVYVDCANKINKLIFDNILVISDELVEKHRIFYDKYAFSYRNAKINIGFQEHPDSEEDYMDVIKASGNEFDALIEQSYKDIAIIKQIINLK